MDDPEIEQTIEELWRESSQPSDLAVNLARDESRQTAIGHLHMLMQFASGIASPASPEDPVRRYNVVLSCLLTGCCLPDPELRPMMDAITQALTKLPQ